MNITRLHRDNEQGFTLAELMIVIVIVGLLATIAIPAYSSQKRNACCGRTAAELRSLSTGFVAYMAEHGTFPPDSHEALPPGMETYINPAIWTDSTPLGGSYNWEGPDTYGYAALSIFESPEDAETFEILDSLLDDGDLATGNFMMIGGRPTLIMFTDV